MPLFADPLRVGAAGIGAACVGLGLASLMRRSDASSHLVAAAGSVTAGALLLAVSSMSSLPRATQAHLEDADRVGELDDMLEAPAGSHAHRRRSGPPAECVAESGTEGLIADLGRDRNNGVKAIAADADAATDALSRCDGRRGPVIVGVGGASGSGKTSIAELIAARLGGMRVVSLSSDNYYKTLPHDVDPSDYNFDHPSAIDFERLADDLEALRRGADAAVPNYDFVTHARTSEETHISGTSTHVLILDGIFVLYADRVRELCDLTIFTAEDSDVCLARRLRRDIVARGRTVDSVLLQYLRFVKAGYTQFVAPSMTLADVIIPRARDNVVAIDMLARDLQRRVLAAEVHHVTD